jgi:hypothetical protein
MNAKQIEKLKTRGRTGYRQYKGGSRTSIPDLVMEKVMGRDKVCVYCSHPFGDTRCSMATWEHINNDTRDVEQWNIALCCGSCNYSRNDNKLTDWFKTAPRCLEKNINRERVADVIKDYIKVYEKD